MEQLLALVGGAEDVEVDRVCQHREAAGLAFGYHAVAPLLEEARPWARPCLAASGQPQVADPSDVDPPLVPDHRVGLDMASHGLGRDLVALVLGPQRGSDGTAVGKAVMHRRLLEGKEVEPGEVSVRRNSFED